MVRVLGLDIGGANTKYALLEFENNKSKLLLSISEYFPVWKKHHDLHLFLQNIKDKLELNYGVIDSVAFVTTAELADCFQTKEEGIAYICSAVSKIFNDPVILDVNGDFLGANKTKKKWLDVAATNWVASAALLGLKIPNAIVIDIGSTTTDFIPVFNHKVVANGKNDYDRLVWNELIYTGLLRTNVATITHQVKINSNEIPLASEYFATTGDVYFLLNDISEEDFSGETADGKPVTLENSMARLARIVCADIKQLTKVGILNIAKQIKSKQIDMLVKALKKVLHNYSNNYNQIPKMVLIGLGAKSIGLEIMQQLEIENPIIADDILDQESLNCYSAYAVAQLFINKKYMMK
jgi:probable H4MPT-linked C1 transfer pathway protein